MARPVAVDPHDRRRSPSQRRTSPSHQLRRTPGEKQRPHSYKPPGQTVNTADSARTMSGALEPIVENVLIETAALTVQRTAPCSNEGTGGVAQVDPLAATVPDLRRRQGDAAARTNPAYNWRLTLRDLTAKVPGATAGFRPGDRVPGVPTRCNMSHESQFGVPPETEWDD